MYMTKDKVEYTSITKYVIHISILSYTNINTRKLQPRGAFFHN